ncbi:stage II sporulation protein SpoIID [Peptococcaceae bacterium SCADC1_2_3]|nr:stage II sporulation protein SpoIID [Peptococcaceae bacterium SCADC1_2_3]
MIVILFLCLQVIGCHRPAERKPRPDVPRREPTISLYVNESGEKKKLKMEEYIAGVVAAEMDPVWPVNALAAQAILARTFTLENIKAGRVQQLHGTDASTSTEEFQAYNAARINENVREAIKRTRGEVVTYQGDCIKAWFCACNGGVTASAAEGLSYTKTSTPYAKAGIKDDCLKIVPPDYRAWEAIIPLTRVQAAVAKITGNAPGEITSAQIIECGPSGRATKIKLGGAVVGAPALRLNLGSEWVRSTFLMAVVIQDGSLILKGKGFGHGVGMCQWGARQLAQEGKSPEEIIRFYFKGVEIKKYWP